MVWWTTKTHQRREVPIPRFLIDDLAKHLEGRESDDLVFAGISSGNPLRVNAFRNAFRPAAKAIGIPDLYPHEMRHTAASLAIAPSADVKVVQQMPGHGSATMALDTYGHLFGNRLDEVAEAMDAAREVERHEGLAAVPTESVMAEPGKAAVARVLPEGQPGEQLHRLLEAITAGQGPFLSGTPNGIRTRATAVKVEMKPDGTFTGTFVFD